MPVTTRFERRGELFSGALTAAGLTCTVAALALGGCGGVASSDSGAASETRQALAAEPAPVRARGALRLKVMTFNIFYGGDDLDLETGDFCPTPDGCNQTFEQVVQTIRASKADIVGVQEPERNTARLAQELGWHFDERNHVI